ncbi:FAD-binding protein [Aquitalea sp. ASV11]|uniref:FAD-binding protein n=1 Tax=Aquitalea sp. ASV11 TaxID=2795103 RepID=UPI00351C8084
MGAATGLQTDTQARVLGRDGQPIAGLYAVGNDMHSIMGGVYTCLLYTSDAADEQ